MTALLPKASILDKLPNSAKIAFTCKQINIGNIVIQVVHGKLSEGRRVAIPAELCNHFGLRPGDPIVLESSDSGIMVRPLDAVIREVQAFCADLAPKNGGHLSDELIRERREEAALGRS